MLSRDLGGIQQSFLDYSNMLTILGIDNISVTSRKAKINSKVSGKHIKLPNLLSFDIISKYLLRKAIIKERPDFIICHGKRATKFALSARKKLEHQPIIVCVAHNYVTSHLKKSDYVISITEDLKTHLVAMGIEKNKIFVLPNTLNHENYKIIPKIHSDEFRVGTISRFVKKKGIDVFIKAIKILKNQNITPKVYIGGSGEEEKNLKKLSKDLGLDDLITFTGWVDSKEEFFANIDLFCLPSLHEPFGIIILESMQFNTPIISTKTEGPLEILTDMEDSLLVESNNPEQIAEKIKICIENRNIMNKISENALIKLKNEYYISEVSKKFAHIIQCIKNDI